MDHDGVEKTRGRIRGFLIERVSSGRLDGIEDDDSLVDSGVIDSMTMLEVIEFIEKEFGVRVQDEDVLPENFDSIARISAFIEKKTS